MSVIKIFEFSCEDVVRLYDNGDILKELAYSYPNTTVDIMVYDTLEFVRDVTKSIIAVSKFNIRGSRLEFSVDTATGVYTGRVSIVMGNKRLLHLNISGNKLPNKSLIRWSFSLPMQGDWNNKLKELCGIRENMELNIVDASLTLDHARPFIDLLLRHGMLVSMNSEHAINNMRLGNYVLA